MRASGIGLLLLGLAAYLLPELGLQLRDFRVFADALPVIAFVLLVAGSAVLGAEPWAKSRRTPPA